MSSNGNTMASGTPALLIAVYFNCVIGFASILGYIPPNQYVACLVVSILAGFLVFLGGLIELIRGDIIGGTLNMVFGLFFIMLGGVTNAFVFWGSLAHVAVDVSLANAWIYFALGIVLIVLTPCFLYASGLFVVLLLCADFGVMFIALVGFGILPLPFLTIAAWLILALGLIALYSAAAIMLNTSMGKMKFPLGGPVIKPQQSGIAAK